MLGDALRERLGALPGVTLRDLGTRRCGIVTFTVDDEDPFALAARLRSEAINISVSTIDFARYDLGARGLDAVARASVHYYNTEDELDRTAVRGAGRRASRRIHGRVSSAQRENRAHESAER